MKLGGSEGQRLIERFQITGNWVDRRHRRWQWFARAIQVQLVEAVSMLDLGGHVGRQQLTGFQAFDAQASV